MHQKMLGGVASVGLSALLAGLLVIAAGPNQPKKPVASIEVDTKASVRPQANMRQRPETPTAVMLPDPPNLLVPNKTKKAAKPSRATLKPLEMNKINPTPAIVPIQPHAKQPLMTVAVRPLLPRRSAPNVNVLEPPNEGLLPPPIETTHLGAKTKTAAAIAQASEDAALAEQGRVLLRMLEHGRGPAIELAWPAQATDQERLYRTFRDCLGMRLALQNGAGHLYIGDMPSGQVWQPNIDHYSGFARQPTGRLAAAERRDILNISQHHNLSRQTSAIRIFPRRVDAQLLGGLRRLVGDSYGGARNIRANYHLFAGGVVVTGIRADGRHIAGGVALAAPVKSGCGKS